MVTCDSLDHPEYLGMGYCSFKSRHIRDRSSNKRRISCRYRELGRLQEGNVHRKAERNNRINQRRSIRSKAISIAVWLMFYQDVCLMEIVREGSFQLASYSSGPKGMEFSLQGPKTRSMPLRRSERMDNQELMLRREGDRSRARGKPCSHQFAWEDHG